MDDEPTQANLVQPGGPQFREALDRLERLVLDGLRHGIFDVPLPAKLRMGKRRSSSSSAGKSQQIHYPRGRTAALTRRRLGDPCDGDAQDANHVGPAPSVRFRDRRPGARDGKKPTVRSSMKPSHAANDNLIDRTRQVWQSRIGATSPRGRPADRRERHWLLRHPGRMVAR